MRSSRASIALHAQRPPGLARQGLLEKEGGTSIFRTLEPQAREVLIMDVVEPARLPENDRPTLHTLIGGFSEHAKCIARCWRVPSRDVDDVMQDAFLRAHRALPRYRPSKVGPKPWFTTIAIRAAQDHLRRHALREALMDDEAMDEFIDPRPSAEDCARFAEARRIACAIMRGLPEELREVYQLHLDGADERYIAELTGLRVTTVHARLQRARGKVGEAVAALHRNEERRMGAASVMLSIVASPAALFAAAEKAPPEPGLSERVLASLAKKVGLASRGVLASFSALYVAGLGAAILVLGAGMGATIACAANPAISTTIVMREPACAPATSMISMTTAATVSAIAVPPESHEDGSARSAATAQLSPAAPPRPRWEDQSQIDAARVALNMGDAQGAKVLLVEHARLYPSSPFKDVRELMLRRANAEIIHP